MFAFPGGGENMSFLLEKYFDYWFISTLKLFGLGWALARCLLISHLGGQTGWTTADFDLFIRDPKKEVSSLLHCDLWFCSLPHFITSEERAITWLSHERLSFQAMRRRHPRAYRIYLSLSKLSVRVESLIESDITSFLSD